MGCGLSKKPSKRQGQEYLFSPILDRFNTLIEVQEALRQAGLESSNLIVGVDFTKSNTWTGNISFEGRCLHDVSGHINPYQSDLSVLEQTLEAFDDDHLIPAFGFGDVYTTDKSCFPFYSDRPCHGLQEVLDRYQEIAPGIELAGPTNFAPIIDVAIKIVRETKAYHILLIIADGQVTQEDETIKAIVRASSFPLSIVLVGVGDGPWDQMRRFDDELPQRRFDNFQFVCFDHVKHILREVAAASPPPTLEAAPAATEMADAYFAMAALMEIPEQFRAIRKLRLLAPS
jgi:hypothetical protein